MCSVETTSKRFKVEVPSTAVMDIHRSMKSHVTVLLRRQAPCPRNRPSPCVMTVRAAGQSPQPRSSPTVKRLSEQLWNPISAFLSCRRWPDQLMVAAWRRTLSNRPPERNSSCWRGSSRATSGAPSSRRTQTACCRSAWRCCHWPIFNLLRRSYGHVCLNSDRCAGLQLPADTSVDVAEQRSNNERFIGKPQFDVR